jgi:hypothetical protein
VPVTGTFSGVDPARLSQARTVLALARDLVHAAVGAARVCGRL